MNFLSQPFALLLRAFYSFTKNYALALIFFTLVIKLIFVFVNILQHKSTVGQARIKPKMLAIRKRYEGRTDRYVQTEYTNDIMKLNQEENVKASSGCLPLLIQLLVVMVLFSIISAPLTYISQVKPDDLLAVKQIIIDNFGQLSVSDGIRKSIQATLDNAQIIDKAKGLSLTEMELVTLIQNNKAFFGNFLTKYSLPDFTIFGGAINLAENPSFSFPIIFIPLLTIIFQLASYFVTQLVGPKTDTSTPEGAQMAKSMLYTNLIMAVISGILAFSFPAIIGVYWIYQSIFGTVISVILHKVMPVPTYTEEEVQTIIADYNKDYVRPEIPVNSSLHFIDEDDYEGEEDDDADEGEDGDTVKRYDTPEMPERRRYDKNGNKIRSLHFIDEDDDEEIQAADGEPSADESDDDSKKE